MELAVRIEVRRLAGNPQLLNSWIESAPDSIEGRAVRSYFLEKRTELLRKVLDLIEDRLHPEDGDWKNFAVMERAVFGLMPQGACYWYERKDGSGGGSDGRLYGWESSLLSLRAAVRDLQGMPAGLEAEPGYQVVPFIGKAKWPLTDDEGFGLRLERTENPAIEEQLNLGPCLWSGDELLILGSPNAAALNPASGRWRQISSNPHLTGSGFPGTECALPVGRGMVLAAWFRGRRTVGLDLYDVELDRWETLGVIDASFFYLPAETAPDARFWIPGAASIRDGAVVFVQHREGPLRGFRVGLNGSVEAISTRNSPAIAYLEEVAIHGFGSRVFVWGVGAPNLGAIWDAEWDLWKPLPETAESSRVRRNFGHCAMDTEVAIFGGVCSSSNTEIVPGGIIYSMSEDRWRPLPSQPALPGRRDFSMFWTGKALILWRGDASLNESMKGNVETALDPVSGSWKVLAMEPGPGDRNAPVCVWTGKEIILVGGYGRYRYYYDSWAFDPSTETWRRLENFLNRRGACLEHPKVHVTEATP
jgi:hypothetical protein